jgi:hypothetical protein
MIFIATLMRDPGIRLLGTMWACGGEFLPILPERVSFHRESHDFYIARLCDR